MGRAAARAWLPRGLAGDLLLIAAGLALAVWLYVLPQLRVERDAGRFLDAVGALDRSSRSFRDRYGSPPSSLAGLRASGLLEGGAALLPEGYGPLSIARRGASYWIEAPVPAAFCGFATTISMTCGDGVFRQKLAK